MFFSLYIKMGETIYYKRNRETVFNRTKDCYKNNKKVLKEKSEKKYWELSE